MNNSILKNILIEYDKKRILEIAEAKNRKNEIYNKYPRLKEIDLEISKCSIEKAKLLINSNKVNNYDIQLTKLKNEKSNILKSIHITPSYFVPKYECNLCNDTGYIIENYKTQMCNCLKQQLFNMEYNTFNVYNMQNQTFDKFDSTLYSKAVDKTKYNSSISPKENIEIIKKICENFILNFDNPLEKNLLFSGKSGLGKTFLSNCIANELLKNGKTVLYQTAPVMLDTIINYKMR